MPRYEFRLPDIGEGLAEAEVARWLVAVVVRKPSLSKYRSGSVLEKLIKNDL